jgi:PLP dependent protein
MSISRDELATNLGRIRERIARACARSGRDPSSVRLVGASKTVAPELVHQAFAEGVTEFGENYLRELVEKRPSAPDATWHYIGALQSGTAHRVAECADVVETLASRRASERLARRASERGRTIDALIEVDFTGERTGVAPEHLGSVAGHAASLAGLRLAGLMTVPPVPTVPDDARPWFRRLRELGDELRKAHPTAVELSMGMSLDYEIAVEEGATMVRIGAALFGARPPRT